MQKSFQTNLHMKKEGVEAMVAERKKRRYPNLEAEMARKGVTKTDIALLLHRTNGSITTRFDGSSEWLYWEVCAIWQYLKPDLSLTELFEEMEVV